MHRQNCTTRNQRLEYTINKRRVSHLSTCWYICYTQTLLWTYLADLSLVHLEFSVCSSSYLRQSLQIYTRCPFVCEREEAVIGANNGDIFINEQLVWVLTGDGNDIGPYSSSTLVRSLLPPKLGVVGLFLDDNSGPKMYFPPFFLIDRILLPNCFDCDNDYKTLRTRA
ncbi:hypothetical protein IW261DRAFT_1136761 [Armillaria novae-zelandiae]|uniref:Uncharacterized protein n=1 Tax=Armillaria novae-zelandiae TaxID=153914 RepID=A0AA39TCW8_9AGAR|nr:hypothetical protein IW261DRAFT_1136761 [Armillaria novae-zelandiae]